ncbi:hypothetical protein AQ621_05990 [Marinobacter sp. P4B1]|nr:hypothetical protein AQ621_05990 [Marinobacter sp. P4B1]
MMSTLSLDGFGGRKVGEAIFFPNLTTINGMLTVPVVFTGTGAVPGNFAVKREFCLKVDGFMWRLPMNLVTRRFMWMESLLRMSFLAG